MRSALKILLVEDNAADAMLVREYLVGRHGPAPTVTHVVRARDAVAYLQVEEPDVILLDLLLPDTMGLDSVAMVRDAAPDSPIVVISGLEDNELTARSLAMGVHDYLLKDHMTPMLLRHAIDVAIARVRLALCAG